MKLSCFRFLYITLLNIFIKCKQKSFNFIEDTPRSVCFCVLFHFIYWLKYQERGVIFNIWFVLHSGFIFSVYFAMHSRVSWNFLNVPPQKNIRAKNIAIIVFLFTFGSFFPVIFFLIFSFLSLVVWIIIYNNRLGKVTFI